MSKTLTVKDLIKKLKKFPPDLKLYKYNGPVGECESVWEEPVVMYKHDGNPYYKEDLEANGIDIKDTKEVVLLTSTD
jgi:hypothetical protein